MAKQNYSRRPSGVNRPGGMPMGGRGRSGNIPMTNPMPKPAKPNPKKPSRGKVAGVPDSPPPTRRPRRA